MIISIQLIRHGKTKGNLEKRFAGGKTDDSLCAEGISELSKFISEKTYRNCGLLLISPMKRCIETAKQIFPEKEAVVVEEFREIDFGIFENKTHEELDGNKEYQEWIDSNGMSDIPCGEKLDFFRDRVMNGFYRTISNTTEKQITAVIHGGTIMAILSSLNGGKYYEYLCKNGKGFYLEYSTEENKILNLRKL